MENNLIQCHHCGTPNFESQKYCAACSFRLPVQHQAIGRYYKKWNATLIQTLLVLLVLMLILAFSVRIV